MTEWYKNLIISEYAEKILAYFKDNKHLVISSPTGTGKTIFVPRYLYKHMRLNGRVPTVWVSQITVAQVELNSDLAITGSGDNRSIGHVTGRGSTSRPNAGILYMTEGILTGKLGDLSEEDAKSIILIIDEAHELTMSTIINLALAKEKGVKIIVMSATANTKVFSNYLDNCPIIEVKTKSFPVSGSPLHGKINQKPSSSLESTCFDYVKAGYSFVVLLPGKKEIETICNAILGFSIKSGIKVTCYPMHGELSSFERLKYLNHDIEKDGLCIIVATNVGRTGLTYPKFITGVIDGGQTNRMFVNNLIRMDISQAESLQGAGRLGRIEIENQEYPEYLYTLCNDLPYEDMSKFPPTASQLNDGKIFAINCIKYGIKNQDLVTPCDQTEYDLVILGLISNGVVFVDNHGDFSFTEKGNKISSLLPLMSYEQAITIYYAMKMGIAIELSKFLGVMYTKYSSLVSKSVIKKNPEAEKELLKFYSENKIYSQAWADILFMNNNIETASLYSKLNDEKGNPHARKAIRDKIKKLSSNYIDINASKEALEGFRKITNILRLLGYKKDTETSTQELVALVGIFANTSDFYSTRRGSGTRSDNNSMVIYNNEKYISGCLKMIGGATFLTTVTYFNDNLLDKAYKIDPSIFELISKNYIVDTDKLIRKTLYKFNSTDIYYTLTEKIKDPKVMLVEILDGVNVDNLDNINTRLNLLNEVEIKPLNIKEKVTINNTKVDVNSVVSTREAINTTISSLLKTYSYLFDLLPEHEDLTYKSSYILKNITNIEDIDINNLEDNFNGITLKFKIKDLYDEFSLDQVKKLKQDYLDDLVEKKQSLLKQEKEEKEKQDELARLLGIVRTIKINHEKLINIDTLFTSGYNDILKKYQYLVTELKDSEWVQYYTLDQDEYQRIKTSTIEDIVSIERNMILEKDLIDISHIVDKIQTLNLIGTSSLVDDIIKHDNDYRYLLLRYNVNNYYYTLKINKLWEEYNKTKKGSMADQLLKVFGVTPKESNKQRRRS